MYIFKKLYLYLLCALCMSFFLVCMAQSDSFIQEGSIGKQVSSKKEQSTDEFPFVPIEEWVGKKFIFLPEGKENQKFGYQSFPSRINLARSSSSNFPDNPLCLSYQEYVGRIATVVKIEQGNPGFKKVHFRMDDDGESVIGEAIMSKIHDIAPIADIQKARDKWKGQTLWLKNSKLLVYDAEMDTVDSIEINRFSPVVVRNVVAGWDDDAPVRFIVEAPSGKQGYVDVVFSGTNVSEILRKYRRFDSYFFESDPKTIYDWSEL
jgi:hypothetical protein